MTLAPWQLGAVAASGEITIDVNAEVTVRIGGRPRADGRFEAGLQQQGANGQWPEDPMLPRLRYVPANAPVGEWLYSSPLTLVVGRKLIVVRIGGKPLGSGRIEAALQQLGADGEWGALLFPATRILPADAPVGVWQYSSSLKVVTDSGDVSGGARDTTARGAGARSNGAGDDALMDADAAGTP